MDEIDWGKAPEGADKYNTYNKRFYKGAQPDLQVFTRGEWKQSIFAKSDERFVCRPTTPSWSGEGLPPVGVVCEARWGRTNWSRCVVFAHKPNANGGTDVLVDVDGDWTFFDKPSMFRPLRTPEQIAADERESAVSEMRSRFAIYDIAGVPWENLFAQMYDAGYRKP